MLWLRDWLRRRREKRAAELRELLGEFTIYGSGPYGTSNEHLREWQIELARLTRLTHTA